MLQDNLLKSNEVNCVDMWNTNLIETAELENLIELVRPRSTYTVARSAMNPEELTLRDKYLRRVDHHHEVSCPRELVLRGGGCIAPLQTAKHRRVHRTFD